MKIKTIRFPPGWWPWLPGPSKQLDLRPTDERASKEKFKAQVQLCGLRLNVAMLATGSTHHFAQTGLVRLDGQPERAQACVSVSLSWDCSSTLCDYWDTGL